MRRSAFRIAEKLLEISTRANEISKLIADLAENGESWEVEAVVQALGDH